MYRFIVVFVIVLAGLLEASYEEPEGNQFFIKKPENMTVREHSNLTLECVVGNLQGEIQWSRDGFALGIDQEMVALSCEKCTLMSPERGYSVLHVQNVLLGEGKEYECQVSPGSKGPKVLLRAHVYVEILVPPKRVKFEKPKSVVAGNQEIIACTSSSSNPATKLLWYKNEELIQNAELEEEILLGDRPGTYTTVSRIKIRPVKEDNGVFIICVADHPAIFSRSDREYFQYKSKLNVLYPPERGPIILGDLRPMRTKGEIITLTCLSRGGNPLPDLYWERGQRKINPISMPQLKSIPSTDKNKQEGTSQSILKFVATPRENNISFSCSSFSKVQPKSLHSENNASFVIEFPPRDVKIEGPRAGRVGSLLNFNCTAFNGNPAPRIEWSLNGDDYVGASINNHTKLDNRKGGYIFTSQISVHILETDAEEISLACSAISRSYEGEIMKEIDEISITVLKPPSQPRISGLPVSKSLREGERVQLNCSSPDGSPRPRVDWYLGDSPNVIPESVYAKVPIPHSMINLTASRRDNERIYRCSARNDANVHKPSSTTITLQVFFPPDSVIINVERPQSPKSNIVQSNAVNPYYNNIGFRSRFSPKTTVLEGEFLRVTCQSSSSKPRATIQWHVNGLPHKSQSVSFPSGEFGGTRTVSVIEFKASYMDHGQVFECFAKNIAISETRIVKTNLTLNVLYAPKFDSNIQETYSMVEGETRNISLSAVGNPSEIKYVWDFPSNNFNRSRFIIDGPFLIIQNANRRDAGRYRISASNSYGNFTTSKSVMVNVQYAPSIVELTPNKTIEELSTVEFHCKVDANPISDQLITWTYEEQHPLGLLKVSTMRTNSHMSNSTSTLTIISAHRGNTGYITCHARNNISKTAIHNRTYLTVNHKPWIFKSPTLNKFAIPKGDPAELTCRSTGVPEVHFKWEKTYNGRTVTVLPIDEYKGETVKPKKEYTGFRFTWDSVLRLDHVRPEYYSTIFRCIASNKFGEDIHTVELVPRGKPDPPINVRFLASNHNSVTLTWDPGFDGGYNQTYFVTVIEERTGNIVGHLLNVNNIQGNVTTIIGLRPRTPYSFKITAKNKAGISLPGGELIKKTEAMEHSLPVNDGILSRVAIIGIIIGVIIAFMIFLVFMTCFIKQRKRRRTRRRSSTSSRRNSSSKDKSDNKSVMIERYTPSKYSSAMSDELFFPSGSFEKQRSNSVCSSIQASNYKELARSFSVPGPGSEDDTESSYNPVLPNGDPFGGKGPTCSKHRTLDYRKRQPMKGWRNISYGNEEEDDEVFGEPRSSAKGFFSRQINKGFRSEEVGLPSLPMPPPHSSSSSNQHPSRFKPNGFIGGRRHNSGGYSLSSETPIFHPRRRESATPSPLPGVGIGIGNSSGLPHMKDCSSAYTLPRKTPNLEFTNLSYFQTAYEDVEKESSFCPPPPRRMLPPPPTMHHSSSHQKSSDSLEDDDDSDMTCPPPPPPPLSTMTGTGRRNFGYK
ncbi:nephrin isoform X1 [Lepeophtheirus salmonis]|uniref:nephrin isoform X1 n=1 Tax=Lepeophtheirus salmonis TaxID=72036 RepID=UPI001AE4A6D8|nr:nephrin-like isoform X1 [Lepeophtheirus salmonis]